MNHRDSLETGSLGTRTGVDARDGANSAECRDTPCTREQSLTWPGAYISAVELGPLRHRDTAINLHLHDGSSSTDGSRACLASFGKLRGRPGRPGRPGRVLDLDRAQGHQSFLSL